MEEEKKELRKKNIKKSILAVIIAICLAIPLCSHLWTYYLLVNGDWGGERGAEINFTCFGIWYWYNGGNSPEGDSDIYECYNVVGDKIIVRSMMSTDIGYVIHIVKINKDEMVLEIDGREYVFTN